MRLETDRLVLQELSWNDLGSIKVLEKSGRTRPGLWRKILLIRGEWYDNYMYAILDEDRL